MIAEILVKLGGFWKEVSLKKEVTLGDLATIATAVVAMCALWLAWYQLRGLARQTRATVLLTLDERWESAEVVALRQELEKLIRETAEEAKRRPATGRGLLTPADLFPDRLEKLRNDDPDTYSKLFRLCGFFETVAYVARAKYITVKDLDNLLGASISDTGKLFRNHIVRRQRETGIPGFLEHYIWLVDEIERRARPWWRRWK